MVSTDGVPVRRPLTTETYRVDPATGEESPHVQRTLPPAAGPALSLAWPPCECGDAACRRRGGRP